MMTLQERTSYVFKNQQLLLQALTHKSFHNENLDKSPGHNERLEFLGDAVLDLTISYLLMKKYPNESEGELSKWRANLVNETTLAKVALFFEFDRNLLLGKGEQSSGGSLKPRLLASVFEAFVGALFVDSGYERVSLFIEDVLENKMDEMGMSLQMEFDYKTQLQEIVQETYKKTPVYKVIKEHGPDHDKVFHVQVNIDKAIQSVGFGKSKKSAEQNAAKKALGSLK